MKFKNKKIYLLLAGGTTLSENEPITVENESEVRDWFLKMPELNIMAEVEPVFICGETSSLAGIKLWQKIAKEIYGRLSEADGFIVTSRSHELLFNALALSFAILNLNKPVVFTGSQLPVLAKDLVEQKKGAFGGLGIKANLINAVQLATMTLPAVGLIFGNRCLRPAKAQRTGVYSLNIFSSVDQTYLATIDFGVSPEPKLVLPKEKPVLKDKFEPKVVALRYYPGMDFGLIKNLALGGRGLFIESLTLAPLPKEFLQGLAALKMPVVIFNRFYVPPLPQPELMGIFNLTKEAALVKFIWALGQSAEPSVVRSLMFKEYCSEFIPLNVKQL